MCFKLFNIIGDFRCLHASKKLKDQQHIEGCDTLMSSHLNTLYIIIIVIISSIIIAT